MFDFTLTDEQKLLKKEITRFAKRELNEGIIERDRNNEFSKELWLKCGEMGLQGLPVPEEYGGSGLDPISTAIALEALGYGCEDGGLNFSICAHLLACVIPIMKFASDEQKKKYLPKLCSGEFIAVNGITEAESGSDVYAMTSKATLNQNQYIINGTKIWSSNGPVADLAVFYAKTNPDKGYYGGITGFILEKGKGFVPGQKFEKMGLRTCPIGELICDNVQVGIDSRLGEEGAGATIFSYSMDWERVCIAANHVGTMQRLLEKAVHYARNRKQGGKKIGDYQAISHKISQMKINLEAAKMLTYSAAAKLDKDKTVSLDGSITKVFTSEALVSMCNDLIQIFGGNGIMIEYEVERALRDAMASRIYSGTNEVHRNIIAKWQGI